MVFYTQVDCVAMWSPLRPSLANAFLCHHETKWLNDCPEKIKPVFYKRYVDDSFVLRKEIFTGVYTNFSTFIPLKQKFGLTYTLLHRWFCLVSDIKFHFEIEKLKEILLSNGYSNKFIGKCISKFMNKLYIKKPVMVTVLKKQLYLVLPFIGKMSALIKSRLIRSLC